MAKKILDINPINIDFSKLDEIKKSYNRDQQVSLICARCGNTFNRSLRFILSNINFCRKCQIEETAKNKYGSLEAMQKVNLEHGKLTSLKKYGKGHYTNRERCNETKKLKYGNEHYTNREKCKNTLLEKYGVDNPSKINGIPDKVRQTKLKKYGTETYNNVSAAKQTCLKKYGVENPGCLKATYIYKNVKFDSSWELYLWLYCEQNKISIKRATETFDYIFNNKLHKYHPDFIIDGKLFEVKGDQFFKDDGTMQNPYDHSMDALYEAKHKCGLANNVTFLTKSDMSDIIDFVNDIFPINYIDNFRIIEN